MSNDGSPEIARRPVQFDSDPIEPTHTFVRQERYDALLAEVEGLRTRLAEEQDQNEALRRIITEYLEAQRGHSREQSGLSLDWSLSTYEVLKAAGSPMWEDAVRRTMEKRRAASGSTKGTNPEGGG